MNEERVAVEAAAIRAAREATGLSRAEYSAKLGINSLYLANLENGRFKTAPRDLAVRLIAMPGEMPASGQRRRVRGRLRAVR